MEWGVDRDISTTSDKQSREHLLRHWIRQAHGSTYYQEHIMPDTLPTKTQFMAYVRVQQEGRFNMFSTQARQLTGLSVGVYGACMDNYAQLLAKYSDGRGDEDSKLIE